MPLARAMTARVRRAARFARAKGKADEPEDVDPEEIELDAMERMEKTMDAIANDFSTVRTGRANAAVLDRIEVDYYGAPTPLKTPESGEGPLFGLGTSCAALDVRDSGSVRNKATVVQIGAGFLDRSSLRMPSLRAQCSRWKTCIL